MIQMTRPHYHQIAGLFDFPGPEFMVQGQEVLKSLQNAYPEAHATLKRFLDGLPDDTVAIQELYTRTFDVQSITTLDIGYVMFGDDYKRAELLSNLTREHVKAGTDQKGELGDHLPNILRLMPNLNDEPLLQELVSEILLPALMLMIREFDSDRIQKKNAHYKKHFKTLIETASDDVSTIYRFALIALMQVLKRDFDIAEMISRLEAWSTHPQTADFLGFVGKELEIEKNANPGNSGRDS